MNSLANERIKRTLAALHAEAGRDDERWAERRRRQAAEPAPPGPDPLIRMGEMYISVSPADGELLYLLNCAKQSTLIIEFGASYGISTIYLGAAAKDCGGRVITSEVHPDKCRAARTSLADAGLDDAVELREGDALETLTTIDETIDFVFLDGWKSLYLPVFELLKPNFVRGTLVAADNISFKETAPYLEAIRAADSGFVNHTVGDMELSCYTG